MEWSGGKCRRRKKIKIEDHHKGSAVCEVNESINYQLNDN